MRKRYENRLKIRTWEECLTEFINWKKVQGLSKHTIGDYERSMTLFMSRYPEAWDSPHNLKSMLYEHLAQPDIAPATYNGRLVYLRTFLKWCVENNYIRDNPLTNLKKRREEGRRVSVDIEVLRELLKVPDQSTFTGLRDYALILLTLDTGIRPSEALALVPSNFRPQAREIHVTALTAKTRRSRDLPISDATIKAMNKLIRSRPLGWADKVPIFCTYEGNALNRHVWGDRLERHSKKIGVHIRPYDLRHIYALESIRNGSSSFAVQKTLGHSTMEMTKRYVALINDDLKVEHAKTSPLTKIADEKPKRKRLTKIRVEDDED
ncbi:tyrosine-type recombinase/integrase [Paenibacillus sp. MER 99-2]|uniref:tyrosine-type recombinase/integrase n=1 Tax=Paenibacillus sp. MER 99-2 TaxID=2939572 RepID=UPI00203AD051|nr:tyrosine-type recombinase/integrase [Paenibacillus sp. MER 99-2]MCM3175921.1 tyrosine-type recombinase/integrase [Paenibacillus sp. MER 99-2]